MAMQNVTKAPENAYTDQGTGSAAAVRAYQAAANGLKGSSMKTVGGANPATVAAYTDAATRAGYNADSAGSGITTAGTPTQGNGPTVEKLRQVAADLAARQGAGSATGTESTEAPAAEGTEPAATLPVTYIDDNGEKQQGVIRQYQATAATGATGTSATAGAAGTPAAAEAAPASAEEAAAELGYYDQMADRYRELYEAQVAANNEEAAAATAQTLAEIERQKEKLSGEYEGLNKELYREYMQSLRTLPEFLAAQGMTGGLAESSRVKLDTGYGENLNTSEQQRLASLADLDAEGVKAQYTNDASARQANQSAWQNYMQYLMQNDAARYQEEQTRQQNAAKTLASIGDFSGYVTMGILTEAQAKAMRKAWIAENPELAVTLGYKKAATPTYYYGAGSGTGGENKPDDVTAYNNLSAEARQLVDYYRRVADNEETAHVTAFERGQGYTSARGEAPGYSEATAFLRAQGEM